MAKSKAEEKKKSKKVKASQLVLRVEKADRDSFVQLCKEQGSTAGREIRKFMRARIAAALPALTLGQGEEGSETGEAQQVEPDAGAEARTARAPIVAAEPVGDLASEKPRKRKVAKEKNTAAA